MARVMTSDRGPHTDGEGDTTLEGWDDRWGRRTVRPLVRRRALAGEEHDPRPAHRGTPCHRPHTDTSRDDTPRPSHTLHELTTPQHLDGSQPPYPGRTPLRATPPSLLLNRVFSPAPVHTPFPCNTNSTLASRQ